jgi:dolichol-phosphate mannosyltransferase
LAGTQALDALSIIIPCYNEAGGMARLRDQLDRAAPAWRSAGIRDVEILLFDNRSTDGTLDEMHEVFGGAPNVTIHLSPTNLNIGGALRVGRDLTRGGIVAMMDADCTYDPAALAPMIRAIREEGFELATGSPYHPDGEVLNVQAWRLVVSRGLSVLYRVLTPLKLWTYTSMFRAYRRDALEAIHWDSDGFLSNTEIVMEATAHGYRVFEHPTTLSVRQNGVSKIEVFPLMREHLRYLARVALRRPRPTPAPPRPTPAPPRPSPVDAK